MIKKKLEKDLKTKAIIQDIKKQKIAGHVNVTVPFKKR